MSSIYEVKITALEGECEKLRAAKARLTEERDEVLRANRGLALYASDRGQLSASVKQYEAALQYRHEDADTEVDRLLENGIIINRRSFNRGWLEAIGHVRKIAKQTKVEKGLS